MFNKERIFLLQTIYFNCVTQKNRIMKMKKITYQLLVVLLTISGSWQMSFAQTYFKSYVIDETFSNLGGTLLPEGWVCNSGGSGTSGKQLFSTRGSAAKSDNGYLYFSNDGSGGRGTDIAFPSPAISVTDDDGNASWGETTTWFVEFDYKADTLFLSPRNAKLIAISGSGSKNVVNSSAWYIDAIFGIYLFGDGYFHYWNMDLNGPAVQTSAVKPAYNGNMGPAFWGTADGTFARSGYSGLSNTEQYPDQEKYNNDYNFNNSPEAIAELMGKVSEWNASTKINVTYNQGSWYTITAEMDFLNQKVKTLTITEKDNPSNTATVTDKPFLAPSMIGDDPTIVEPANRIVRDMTTLSMSLSRGTTAGNGHNVYGREYIDNLKVYFMKPSQGKGDVTVYYKDQDNNTAKTARVAPDQQFGELFRLLDSDTEAFTSDGHYYGYNAEATKDINADKGDGTTLIPADEADNTLTVYFKKFPVASGELAWTGAEGPYWNELDGNFKTSAANGLAYQKGLAVAFSDASAPKDVIADNTIDLQASNVTISADGYDLSGAGKLTGTGKMDVNASASLGIVNEMTGGVFINTTSPVTIKNANAATAVSVADNATLVMNQTGNFAKTITGPGKGSTLNIESLTTAYTNGHTYTLTDISTVNIILKDAGKKEGNYFSNYFTATHDSAQVVNIINGVEGKPLTGYGTESMPYVHVILDDSIRITRRWNETDNATYHFGAIDGPETSIIEAGYVKDRTMTYAVGGLGIDAVFAGTIRPFTNGGKYVRTDNTCNLTKVGKGAWTLTGLIDLPGTITAKEGTLIISGKIDTLVKALQVDSAGVMQLGNIDIPVASVNVHKDGKLITEATNFTYGVQVSGTLSGTSGMYSLGVVNGTIELFVNSFNTNDYEAIVAGADITFVNSSINIKVKSATKDSEIQLLAASGGYGTIEYPETGDGSDVQVFVNGVNITGNTEATEGAKFVWDPFTGILKSLVTEDFDVSSIGDINNDIKEIKFVQYFDLLGRPVTKDAKGIVIRRTVYTDNSSSVDKILIAE